MFAKYIIVETEFKNIIEENQVTGFQVGTRIPYYRGISLSMIEELNLTIDGQPVPADQMRITIHGNTYTPAQMKTETTDRWEFGEIGWVTVLRTGGLSAGEHTLEMSIMVRVAYRPMGQIVGDKKTLQLAN